MFKISVYYYNICKLYFNQTFKKIFLGVSSMLVQVEFPYSFSHLHDILIKKLSLDVFNPFGDLLNGISKLYLELIHKLT